MDYLKKRLENLLEFVTSKKVLVTLGAALLIVWVVKTTPAAVAVATIASAYLMGQAYVDGKK